MVRAESRNSQERILYQIKRLGPQTARALGEQLGVTTMGIRQHLAQLEAEGLVSALPGESQARGRPVRRWKLDKAGHARFPDAHAQVTYELITSVRNLLGEAALDKVIDQRTRDTLDHYQAEIDPGLPLEQRVRKLAELRSQEGYMAESQALADGDLLLLEHHCPICIAAQSCQGFCRSELEVFRRVFEGSASVVREEHLIHGARRCSYRISPLQDLPSRG